jgi:tellurite resistance protein TerC
VSVSTAVWAGTLAGLVALLAVDLLVVARRPREPTLRECVMWVTGYVALAIAFGLAISLAYGPAEGGKFFAGWLTEYSLSVDNLFVFMVIMARFAVPRRYQQQGLLIGIVLALVMRGAFILLGATALRHFDLLFYLFGVFLVYTAARLVWPRRAADDVAGKRLLRWSRTVLPVSAGYDGGHLVTRRSGHWQATPMLIVVVALGTTDLVFALDSIPAIFGLTRAAYLVFTANVFALMGLRQLYFLLGDLLNRLVYLSVGLAGVLGFIGLKLIVDALRDNELPFVNGGQGIDWLPEVPVWLSLVVIVGTLGLTAVASLLRPAGKAASAKRGVPPEVPSAG